MNLPVASHSTCEFKQNLIHGAQVLTAEKRKEMETTWRKSSKEIQNWQPDYGQIVQTATAEKEKFKNKLEQIKLCKALVKSRKSKSINQIE